MSDFSYNFEALNVFTLVSNKEMTKKDGFSAIGKRQHYNTILKVKKIFFVFFLYSYTNILQ